MQHKSILTQEQVLSQLDSNALVAIRLITALFVAVFVALSFIFAVTIAVFVAGWFVARQIITLVMSCRTAQTTFAMLGASI